MRRQGRRWGRYVAQSSRDLSAVAKKRSAIGRIGILKDMEGIAVLLTPQQSDFLAGQECHRLRAHHSPASAYPESSRQVCPRPALTLSLDLGDRAMRGLDGGIDTGARGGVAVRDRNASKSPPTDDMRLLFPFVSRIPIWVVPVGVTVAPAVHCDSSNV